MGIQSGAHLKRLPLIVLAALMAFPLWTPAASGQPFTFNVVKTDLPAINYGSVSFADIDRDGDMDVAMSGSMFPVAPFLSTSHVALNLRTSPVETHSVLPFEITELSTTTFLGELSWIDFDNDGDLDLSQTGSSSVEAPFEPVSLLYINDGTGVFSALDVGLEGLYSSLAKWADYDNDGDADLLLTGTNADKIPATYLYRNDGMNTFTSVSTPFRQLAYGDAAWGDYDNDGDFDLVLSGVEEKGAFVTRLYENDGNGGFTETDHDFQGLAFSSLAWGDYDSDGDLDLALSGAKLSVSSVMAGVTRLYRNDDGVFQLDPNGLSDVFYGDLTWGDYDLDGDLDLFVMGQTTLLGEQIGKIYRNDDGAFILSTGLIGTSTANAAWGDYDNDLDLDILVTGMSFVGLPFTHLYRNDQLLVNTAPLAPEGLSATVEGGSATMFWNPATDEHSASLTYNLSVGTSPGLSDVMSSLSSLETGKRWISGRGNVDHNTSWTLKDLPNGLYFWHVQSIDNSYIGSPFSVEGQFTVTASGKSGTDVADEGDLPGKLTLYPGFPNPFAAQTTLSYDLPEPALVRISVYDVLGKEIGLLVDDVQAAGRHSVSWDARSRAGNPLGAGVYFVRMSAGSQVLGTTLIILK